MSSATQNGNAATVPAAHHQAAEDDTDLRESLAGLSQLTLGSTGLAEMLTHVADFAARAIPGADGAGLTLVHDEAPNTVVASAEFVREVDAIQYRLGEGPCVTAALEGRTIRSGSLSGEKAWPRFGPRVGRLGVHSVLSLPLTSAAGIVGALNVYAHAKHAFDERASQLGELFAIPAGISVHTAQQLDKARRVAGQLQSALSSRAVIDQAVGIVMSRSGCAAVEAFDKLRVISQTEHRKLADVAQQVVEEAVRRARARHTGQ
ncbi:GAF and ANTAR domain-containing protein [Mycolicibacterium mengxianglii]|uniref:GAF and ANTAR domain-containing protein n=1 Tax=Mycolicibacterium mengxianglii TaxID=2736649 RepID=UPI0018EF2582|nr:GAF and ANTAR domain-containing protein [Mycolicibacterium mengxianglii]